MTTGAATHKVKVAEVSEIPDGKVHRVRIEDRSLAVVHSEGHWYAIEDRCSHDNGPLADGEVFGSALECPRHGARFSLETGKPMTLPAVKPVVVFPVSLENGSVLVEI